MHRITCAVMALVLAGPALAETADQQRSRTMKENVNRALPASPPQYGPGRDIKTFNGYTGPSKYGPGSTHYSPERIKVPSPISRSTTTTTSPTVTRSTTTTSSPSTSRSTTTTTSSSTTKK